MPPRLLVVDDDEGMRELLGEMLRRFGYQVDDVASAAEGIARMRSEPYDVVLADLLMPGESGFQLLGELRALDPRTPVVLVTGFGSSEVAEHALGFGAFDYLEKPLDAGEVRTVVRRALQSRAPTGPESCEAAGPDADLVGAGAAMGRLFDMVRRVAQSQSSVLVTGESGTGKELIARTIHDLGPRRARAFVPVNCTAVPEGLLESELFGHVRGAFTGAATDRRGLFEQAHLGTLFLDEIGDLGSELQASLLRVLQDGEVRPVGSTRTVGVDVRIVAATHQDLEEAIRAGRFREDLFYRINVIRLRVPPLRERVEDIPALVRAFVRRHARGRSVSFSDAALERLQSHGWPGNARELENVVQRAVVLSNASSIGVAELELEGVMGASQPGASATLGALARRGVTLSELTERYLDEMLALTGGRQGEAARRLGIDRKTLYRRARKRERRSASGDDA